MNFCDDLIKSFPMAVNLREIKEVRIGKHSKDFSRFGDEASKYGDSQCFVIFYGQRFCLNSLSVAGTVKDDSIFQCLV